MESWTTKNQIYALIKNTNKIIKTNIEGVAQERFFYALEEFTLEEEAILKKLIDLWSKDSVKEVNLKFYFAFTSYSKLKRDIPIELIDLEKREEFERRLNILRTNGMEDVHSVLEKFGEKLISVKKIEDLNFLDKEDDLLMTMIYVAFQYLRTKKMRSKIETVIPKLNYLSPKFLNILPFIYSTAIADSLTYDKNTKFEFLDNQTEIDFLTCDQPLINIKASALNDFNVVQQLDLYYPLNPNLAILIHYQDQKDKIKYSKVNNDEVNKYNAFVIENSNEFIFSRSQAQLENINRTIFIKS
ncbi:DUF4238 domain-containing protein [Flavobacterium sp. UBA7663]|uniref:DUF4238 domain-containing protein n=1 Tax=Flavobacterium sp. UBA7663 TaxID=1946557 RepID=UPI0025BD7895|nr:DUF4238 domain-containing protein [Flavobacterium sp. UBA7663]